MPTRVIATDYDRELLVRFIQEQKPPYVVTVTKGNGRTVEQNKLQRLWCNEIAEQLGDRTPEEVRGEMKLTIGVPILRAENESFCEQYDRIVKPLTYEQKLAIMMEPLDLPVTRIMTIKQKTKYLDGIYRTWTERGLVLTLPQEQAA